MPAICCRRPPKPVLVQPGVLLRRPTRVLVSLKVTGPLSSQACRWSLPEPKRAKLPLPEILHLLLNLPGKRPIPKDPSQVPPQHPKPSSPPQPHPDFSTAVHLSLLHTAASNTLLFRVLSFAVNYSCRPPFLLSLLATRRSFHTREFCCDRFPDQKPTSTITFNQSCPCHSHITASIPLHPQLSRKARTLQLHLH